MEIWPGEPYPLGATYDGVGTNFSLFSEIAGRVELCLFDDAGEQICIDLPEVSGFCWHGYLPGIGPGQRYGFRVHGPWVPAKGRRCNPAKLLIDPYAKSVEGRVQWNPAIYPYRRDDPDKPNEADSGSFVPRSIVVDPYFDWSKDHAPRIPLHETILYEVHLKGFTARHPDLSEDLRGTYSGLAHPACIDYLKRLGITAVELMPIHQFVHEASLVERGLRNYWGYNSIGYLAPHNEYSSRGERGQQVAEFKDMVRTLHQSGIEVILDVVYNHTAEGDHLGPMLSFKGIDNQAYYRLADDPRYYIDYSGTGNSLNMRHPHVLQLIMDSLRYWVLEMHVDGFRFDLAATLARELHEVDRLSAFFDVIQQDPVVSQVKLIAEPWDVGEGGYQVGNFPPLWSEWNGKYRDTVRDYFRGREQAMAEFGYRLTGSSDLYRSNGRRPYASINFVTCHDGFTLHDLVSYDQKHNEANGEDNRDGSDDNRSWNCGVEGPTDDSGINALRDRQKRNFLTALFLSQGVPLLLAGDEIGRTQRGNNNAYCQDNEISWLDWEHKDEALLEFARRLAKFKKEHPVFRRRHWFHGRPLHGSGVGDIGWFGPDGKELSEQQWESGSVLSLGVFLNGQAVGLADPRGRKIVDDSFGLLFNPCGEATELTLPGGEWGSRWAKVLNTCDAVSTDEDVVYRSGEGVSLPARSILVLRRLE